MRAGQQGAEPGGEDTQRFAHFVRAETGKWGKVVRDIGIVIE